MAEFIVTPGSDGGVFDPSLASRVKGGDTIIFNSKDKFTYFYGGPICGDLGNPVYFKNRGGMVQLKAGFNLADCQNIIVAGDGDTNTKYGFVVDSEVATGGYRSNAAIDITGKAKGIEAHNVYANNCGIGAWIKNEPGCDDSLNKWVVSDIFIHDSKFSNIQVEGVYCGSTNLIKSGANVRPFTCNGQAVTVAPPLLQNIRINNNIFDSTGRAGIQMSFVNLGVNEAIGNTISNVGKEHDQNQGNGINIGTLSRVRVANNQITNTLCYGISTMGQDTIIEDNIIDNSGYLDNQVTVWALGIYLDTRETTPFSKARATVQRNKIGKRGQGAPTDNGWKDIGWYDQFKGNGQGWDVNNILQNNISTITNQETINDIDKNIKFNNPAPPPLKKLLSTYLLKNYDDGSIDLTKQ